MIVDIIASMYIIVGVYVFLATIRVTDDIRDEDLKQLGPVLGFKYLWYAILLAGCIVTWPLFAYTYIKKRV